MGEAVGAEPETASQAPTGEAGASCSPPMMGSEGFVLLGLEGGIERGLGFFQFGQTLFVFGNLHRPLCQFGLLFLGLQLVFFKLHTDLLLLLMDAEVKPTNSHIALNVIEDENYKI